MHELRTVLNVKKTRLWFIFSNEIRIATTYKSSSTIYQKDNASYTKLNEEELKNVITISIRKYESQGRKKKNCNTTAQKQNNMIIQKMSKINIFQQYIETGYLKKMRSKKPTFLFRTTALTTTQFAHAAGFAELATGIKSREI